MKNKFIKEFQNKSIVIPLLQRDYVQGINKNVINGFVDNVVGVFAGGKTLEINYIYGTVEGDKFYPIDGQQRLTTLWLVHLYLMKGNFSVDLVYESREHTRMFCKILKERINEQLDFSDKENIISQPWFVCSWKKDASVMAMLSALEVIAEKFKDKNINDIENAKIDFAFLDLKEKKLNDNLYVKMNGRGKPLSEFENLKSWLDEKVSTYDFAPEWKSKMDNEWMNLFWENRNKNQDKPQEIDDEQLRFFYNMLFLYYAVNELNTENIKEYLLGKFRKKENFSLSLYELDKTNLFNEKSLKWILETLNNLSEFQDEINSLENLFIETKNTTLFYEIFTSEAPTFEKYAFAKAIISYLEHKGKTEFKDWMRVLRNLIVNTEINDEKLKDICKSVDSLAEKCKENCIYELLNIEGLTFKGFDKQQLEEERIKTRKIIEDNTNEWKNKIIQAEEFAFFKGAIRFLFRANEKGVDWDKFDTRFANAQKFFDEKGVKYPYNENFLLIRYFISQKEFDNISKFNKFKLSNTASEWKNKLQQAEYSYPVNKLLDTQDKIINSKFEIEKLHYYKKDLINEDFMRMIYSKFENSTWCVLWRSKVLVVTVENSKAERKRFVVNNKRNDLLSNLIEKQLIECSQKLETLPYFLGLDILFTYNNTKLEWYSNAEGDFIYVKDENNNYLNAKGGYIKKDINEIKDEDELITKLDELIQEKDEFLTILNRV